MKLLALVLLTAGAVFGQISLGVRIGTPPPPRVLMVQPQSPGRGLRLDRRLLVPRGASLSLARRLLDPSGL